MVATLVTAVLVLDLHHQDWAAVGRQMRTHDLGQLVKISFHRLGVARIRHRAQLKVPVAQQVGGNPAEIPLAAAVRAGAKQHPNAFFLRNLQKFADVAVAAAEVVLAFLGLVLVPEHINRQGVQSHGLGHADAVSPILVRHAAGVHFAGNYLERPAVEEELFTLRAAKDEAVRCPWLGRAGVEEAHRLPAATTTIIHWARLLMTFCISRKGCCLTESIALHAICKPLPVGTLLRRSSRRDALRRRRGRSSRTASPNAT